MRRLEFVKKFQKELSIRFSNGFQSQWTKYIFHFSNIDNVIELGLMNNDNASHKVIANTSDKYKNYVRFYFGAKTPTQYQNEGIKAKSEIKDTAHCPIPVFLLFDFVTLLAEENTLFSSGNIAANNAKIYSNIEDLKLLEFENIYHRDSLPEDTSRGHILYCRQAEVLVANEIEVDKYLKFIYVRSNAEKETLLYGLTKERKVKRESKVMVVTRDGLFFGKELFITDVVLKDNEIVIYVSIYSKNKFNILLYGKDLENNKEFKYEVDDEIIGNFSWLLNNYTIGNNGFYIEITIDGNMIYRNILRKQNDDIF